MGLIVCTAPCVYQQDGCCQLTRAASGGVADRRYGCVNYVPRIRGSQNGAERLPDIGYPDHF